MLKLIISLNNLLTIQTKSGVLNSSIMKLQQRRKSALARLEAQQKSGFKHNIIKGEDSLTPLTEKDVTRIKKEIEVLKSKV